MDLDVYKYTHDQRQLWNDFLNSAKNGLFMFNRNYMEYHQDRFEDHSLMFCQNGEVLALLPCCRMGDVLCSHAGLTFGGFVTNEKMRSSLMLECFDSLVNYMKLEKFQSLIYKAIPHIYHRQPAEEDLYALFRNSASIIKAEPSTTIYLQNPLKISRGRKPHISQAKRCGVQVTESTDFQNYIEIVNQVLDSRHHAKAVHTAEELARLQSLFPENIKLFTASCLGKMMAGTVVFVYPDLVHTQYLAANDEAREIGALDLVLYELIEKYKKTRKYFDFGISTEDGGRVLNEGLIQQKETFGGRTIAHLTFELKIS